ncbi:MULTISPECIES: hypothetical protein [unclassified Novosphingobium]|uniref:hypothetical protein n=1 Tax=unclassified Novosphingobium TaxID=2644732 RepID=UPI001357234F|nr:MULTISPECIES: hypothetical protein [unclassified Novosphingobium]
MIEQRAFPACRVSFGSISRMTRAALSSLPTSMVSLGSTPCVQAEGLGAAG